MDHMSVGKCLGLEINGTFYSSSELHALKRTSQRIFILLNSLTFV
jgi:hypothetical protein